LPKAAKRKPNGQNDRISYDEAVTEGREILAQINGAERGQLRLGELADRLEPKYRDRTLAKFAAELGIAKCTLERYRTVYRAWQGILAPGANISYAVLRELATHPEREEIIRKHPNLTKREAHDLMRKQKNSRNNEKDEDWLKHCRAWFKRLVDSPTKPPTRLMF
jgi:hypothetical protein